MKYPFLILLLLSFFYPSFVIAETPSSPDQLAQAIDSIMKKTRTKGVAVAMIDGNGKVWSYTSGLADTRANKTISEKTQFRIGSISKMFVAMSVLKLIEQNKLSLDDTLASVAPEIEFKNRWEKQKPITVAHLIEHTTGWDAPHFPELAHNSAAPISTLDALALHPHSRVSRWVPGSRTAYNNIGPVVAAYIVEKLSGMSFEKFVRQSFLTPLSMSDTDYFYTDNYKNNAAVLYRGNQQQPYAHIAYRASGAMNSNLTDMTSFARFLLTRKNQLESGILTTKSFDMMERPYSSLAVQAGLELGYGLGTTMFHHNGFLYYGHEGAMRGANSLIAYQKELQMAHVIMTNSESAAVAEIHQLLAEYETQNTLKKPLKHERQATQDELALSGFYRLINPVSKRSEFLQGLLPWQLEVTSLQAWIKPLLGGNKRELIFSSAAGFKQNTTGMVALISGQDPLAGKVLHYGPQTFKQVSSLRAYLPIVILALWLVSALISLIFLFIWIPRRLLNKLDKGATIQVRSWPLAGVIALALLAITLMNANNSLQPFMLTGTVSFHSLVIMLMTLVFASTSLYSGHILFKNRKEKMNRFVYWHSALLSLSSICLTFYLAYYGMIGLRLWT
ncbi:serine hydrolase domain-containing protein [Thalassotalea sp. ND16A]|uniref:serine hydrolase domain-containing protein n=1 Tax=Thalassotalea sp. ND16A TaxID=1535422 RepID=UPI00051A7A26|nr:serine hydrolase domain-containing protein [Thalassotalea sp. ND16A]KGK00522.1 hypothetical protein ND16A_3282 [Thalassotalea sp. ND16A]